MAFPGVGAPTFDVIVIGGGIIGCAIALRCAQAGLKLLVLERGELGAEASTAAAGMIAPGVEIRGPSAFSRLCKASRDLYPQFVAEIEALSGLEVGYRRDGTLLVAVDELHRQELERVSYLCGRAGDPLQRLTAKEIGERVPGLSPTLQEGLFLPGDHWVDNERLMRALTKAAHRVGVKFEVGCRVTSLSVRGSRVERIWAGSSSFVAGQFILAAGCWSAELVASLGLPLTMLPCRGQMLEFESPVELPCVIRAGPHYLVPRSGRRFLAGTTAEYVGFRKAVTDYGLRSILEGVVQLAPIVREARLRRAWAGLRPDTADHLPILGFGNLQNLVFATGHFRNGILLAPITAQLITELVISGSCAQPLELYRPTRFSG